MPAGGKLTTETANVELDADYAARHVGDTNVPGLVVLAALATIHRPDPSVQPDPDTWIANLGTLPLIAQPGERWLYNTGASVLGVLVARATGQPFGEVLRTRLFEPLGMRDTAFWTSDTNRLATAYRPTPDGLMVCDEPAGTWSRPPAFEDGAAGLVSTIDDLHAFARMLMRGGAPVLSAGDPGRGIRGPQLSSRTFHEMSAGRTAGPQSSPSRCRWGVRRPSCGRARPLERVRLPMGLCEAHLVSAHTATRASRRAA